jgi:hypothetical protein
MLLDSFEGDETRAWIEIKGNPNLSVLTSGDECNARVSCADLMSKRVALYLHKAGLGSRQIKEAFRARGISISPRFSDDLAYTTPDIRKPIQDSYNLKHPIFFVMPKLCLRKRKRTNTVE